MTIISGEVSGDGATADGLERDAERVRVAIKDEIERLTYRLARRVTSQKLSGQVLKRRTGTLSRSVAQSPKVIVSENTVEGVVGTNVKYGRTHEFGFKGEVTVKEHIRASVLGRTVQVRSHVRRVDLPERSFLRTALAEMEGEVRRSINEAVRRAFDTPK